MLAPPSPALGARRAATQEGAVDMDSNASRAGEVERKVWQDNDFLLPGKLLRMSPLVDGQSAVSTQRKARGSGAVLLLALEQLSSEVAPTTLLPLRIVALRSRLVGLV